jgi:hypothetical protein
MFKFKKILVSLVVLFIFQTASAVELCSLEGDFVPWPWSEQYYSQVLGQDWVVVDQNGSPKGSVTLSRSSFFWGLGSDVYTMIESDLDGVNLRWGMARASSESDPQDELVFNVWDEKFYPARRDVYKIKMGYWKSAFDQMTVEEESNLKDSPLGLPFTFGTNNVCRSFRQRTDHVVGLILNIESQTDGGEVEISTFYGLTQDPIYTED